MSNKFLIQNLPETSAALSSDLFVVEHENVSYKVSGGDVTNSIVNILSAQGTDLLASTIIRKWQNTDVGQYVISYETAIDHGSVAVAKDGVSISPGGSVQFGEVIKVTVYPDAGYQVKILRINGTDVQNESQYTVYSDVTIFAQVEIIPTPVIEPITVILDSNNAQNVESSLPVFAASKALSHEEMLDAVVMPEQFNVSPVEITALRSSTIPEAKEEQTVLTVKAVPQDKDQQKPKKRKSSQKKPKKTSKPKTAEANGD